MIPFGLSEACRAFTNIMHTPISELRAWDFRVMPHLDDFLCALARRNPAAVAEACTIAGFGLLLNLEKCMLELTRRIVALGFIFNTVLMTFEVFERRVITMIAATALLRATESGLATVRLVARITGNLAPALLVASSEGRLNARHLNDAIRDAAARNNYDSLVVLGPGALDELERWLARLGTDLGTSAIVEVSRSNAATVLVSNASDSGNGGGIAEMGGVSVDNIVARGTFEPSECFAQFGLVRTAGPELPVQLRRVPMRWSLR